MLFRSGSGCSDSGLVTLNQRTIALNLTMLELVARGRYGEVRRALYRGSQVAVKLFYTTEEESWKNERDVYMTQMLNHENILREFLWLETCDCLIFQNLLPPIFLVQLMH